MQIASPAFSLLPLEDLIDYTPPTVGIEATIWDAITLMNEYQPLAQYILVVESSRVVGLFSWKNLLQLVKSQVDLRNSKITGVMSIPAIKIKYSQLQDTKSILQVFADQKEPILIEDEEEQLLGYITPEKIAFLLLQDYQSKITEAEQVSDKKPGIIYSNTNTTNKDDIEKLSDFQHIESSKDDADNALEIIDRRIDISERKQLEQSLQQALKGEKELNELKTGFISMTSHEFRTPLSTILSSAELLENYRNKWDEEKQIKHFNRIKKAVEHMINLLNDVLLFGKFEAEEVNCNPANLDLVEFSRQLVEDLLINQINKSTDRPNVNIDFITDNTKLAGKIDQKTIGHILNNLLSNAIKYSQPETSVIFTLSSQQKQAVFVIQDQGIGIPSEDLPFIFDSFNRCRNVGNIQGTGLGLSIVKKCVEMLQGDIKVTSEVGVGTKFIFSIPLKSCC